MNILLIEDHPLKQEQIISTIHQWLAETSVTVRNSYNSGLRELILNRDSYDLLLLDISMPNYDISLGEEGGDWLPMAGTRILKDMHLRSIPTQSIVITMHGNFDDGTEIGDLDQRLKNEFTDNYYGYVYYSQTRDDWKEKLVSLLNEFV